METAVASQKIDHVLVGLLQTDQAELPAALDRILAIEAEPVITKILRYRIQSFGKRSAINLSTPKMRPASLRRMIIARTMSD